MQPSIFSDIARRAGMTAQTRTSLRIVPGRSANAGPRNGTGLDSVGRLVADRFYFSAKDVVKVVYTKVDARYPDRDTNEKSRRLHSIKFGEAKNILNEHRNEIIEAVLPLFQITARQPGEEPTEADQHAHDYIVSNLFYVMVRTLLAWTDEFVAPDEVEATKKVIVSVGDVQSERLSRELKNFSFNFRPVIAPPRV